jgi:hypothetical protein
MKKYNFNIGLHPDIQFDLREAVDYYNSKRENLGDRFYANARAKMKSLSTDALLYSIKYADVRCVEVPHFPYLIHYRVFSNKKLVLVEAVINMSKDPDANWGIR